MPSFLARLTPELADRIGRLIPRYGQPGSRISGSRYFRWYCVLCGEPMRVTGQSWPPTYDTCEVCGGRHGQIARPASARTEDMSGSQENAIRALEGD